MAIGVYEQTVPVFTQMLNNLAGMLRKLESHAKARNFDSAVVLQDRLYPDMFTCIRQVQIATDFAKGAVARLAGVEPPSWPDNEGTLAQLLERVQKAVDYVNGFKPEQFAGAEDRQIELKFPQLSLSFKGAEYLVGFALPNFYFHYTTAYNILRHNGLEIGKRDFIGERPAA
ncbi:MAG: DUF1993 domain-containing protein [Gammaproteobacteria bacterium]|nr:DUF1993 domain-containing protein [Gammaproteobacteria bacterium]